jgi:hypothetical protein
MTTKYFKATHLKANKGVYLAAKNKKQCYAMNTVKDDFKGNICLLKANSVKECSQEEYMDYVRKMRGK